MESEGTHVGIETCDAVDLQHYFLNVLRRGGGHGKLQRRLVGCKNLSEAEVWIWAAYRYTVNTHLGILYYEIILNSWNLSLISNLG
jgi:hypothetical protein